MLRTEQTAAPLSEQPPLLPSATPGHLAETILTLRRALDGEHNQVAVVVTALKGSMEALTDRKPEKARAVLGLVLELMMAAVHRHEETVNPVMEE
jgi:class 3 adenylate cyclase